MSWDYQENNALFHAGRSETLVFNLPVERSSVLEALTFDLNLELKSV